MGRQIQSKHTCNQLQESRTKQSWSAPVLIDLNIASTSQKTAANAVEGQNTNFGVVKSEFGPS